ncbi:MAG TPA: chromate transporter [Chloroflexota bacterium]|nr:chromate transporter [Chloroflexota bacterium]
MAETTADAGLRPGEIGVLARDVPVATLFLTFAKISARSWGGGSGTIYTMNQELVRRGWITPGQFALDFGLSRLVPGINLIAIAVMTGYRLGGLLGALAATAGFMLPASAITVILTIGFSQFTTHPIGNAAVKGVVPVTAALTFALAADNAIGVLPRRERRTMALMLLYALAAFAASAIVHLSVVFVIVGGGLVGAFLFRPEKEEVGP